MYRREIATDEEAGSAPRFFVAGFQAPLFFSPVIRYPAHSECRGEHDAFELLSTGLPKRPIVDSNCAKFPFIRRNYE